MKKNIIVFILIIVFLKFYGFLSDDKSTSHQVENQKINDRGSDYGSNPTLNNWPKTSATDVALSDNLLAANYYLVLDGSGSMLDSHCSGNTSKMGAAKKAVSEFTQLIPANANTGLYVFDGSGSRERVPLAANNQYAVKKALARVYADAGTPLRSAMTTAYSALEIQAQKQLGYGEYHLVVITDGEAGSSENPNTIVNTILAESPVIIHTIGFCIRGGHSLNQEGRVNYKQANDPASLSKGLQQVLAESPSFITTEFDE